MHDAKILGLGPYGLLQKLLNSCSFLFSYYYCYYYYTHLLLVQRNDYRAVAQLGFADHRLGELDLGRDISDRYGIIVVVGDVQCALGGRRQRSDISYPNLSGL